MPGQKIYLEAPERTQQLLNIKWSLRSAGYTIASSWHDGETAASPASRGHCDVPAMERLQACDSLVVVCEASSSFTPELAIMVGFAIARGIPVFWIGSPMKSLEDFSASIQFDTAENFQKRVLSLTHSRLAWENERVAA